MSDPTVLCPNCKSEIRLTESLAAPMIEAVRQESERRIREKDSEIGRREAEIRRQLEQLATDRASVEQRVQQELSAERAAIAKAEAQRAREALATELYQRDRDAEELRRVLSERDGKLAEALKGASEAKAELLRKGQEIADRQASIELEIATKVRDSLEYVRQQAQVEAEQALKLRVSEKEQVILGMQRQIDELKRRAEQGSQQLQGEVQELELELLLREQFPGDQIVAVPKGQHGGDVLHRVLGSSGQFCGAILWESKRTKNWSDGWLPKLREDQRAARAEIAVIVTQALPKAVDTFGLIESVWVSEPRYTIPLAVALRQSLIEVSGVRKAGEGQETKMQLVYQYMTGSRFRQRIQAIVEKFAEMKEDLDRERKSMTRLWAKREEQMRIVITATAGMYGDLQGIVGQSLHEIDGLSAAPLLGEDGTGLIEDAGSPAP